MRSSAINEKYLEMHRFQNLNWECQYGARYFLEVDLSVCKIKDLKELLLLSVLSHAS